MNILIGADGFISDNYKIQPLIDKQANDKVAFTYYKIVNLESTTTNDDSKNKILKAGPHLCSSEHTVIPYLKQLHIDMVCNAPQNLDKAIRCERACHNSQ